jgi:hypothetical protein
MGDLFAVSTQEPSMAIIPDRMLAREVRARLDAAKAHLRLLMEERGLHASDGWAIVEFARETVDGMAIVLKPLHRRLAAPDDLECVISIRTDTAAVESDCP